MFEDEMDSAGKHHCKHGHRFSNIVDNMSKNTASNKI